MCGAECANTYMYDGLGEASNTQRLFDFELFYCRQGEGNTIMLRVVFLKWLQYSLLG